ncbi:MAG TPA: flagellar basal body P-ring protein FlgI [Spirochaetota bacterium]|nr:flagellar basal body P-ring protein FlgI [Spirochaetota bacterium]HSA14518.1 flagellar basal body P-ring protein FlgI [Spirochaetota bacterium]
MKRYAAVFVISMVFLAQMGARAEISVKIKDISHIDGLKKNQVYGYGLVVGLQGTGDSKTTLTEASLKNLLNNLGVQVELLKPRNCAAVMITADLPVKAHLGDRVDVTVSSIGDAKSVAGGILVQSALKGADDVIYAVAQGTLAMPERQPGGQRPVKTVAFITGGAIIEREIIPEIIRMKTPAAAGGQTEQMLSLVMKEWNYGLANNIIKAVENKYPDSKPALGDDGKIQITLVKDVPLAEFIAEIENLEVEPVQPAVVVINEKDGTLVTGGAVTVSEAMVSKSGLVIEIEKSAKKGSSFVMNDITSVADLVEALNAAGASTSDIIAIFKALKESGALHAELIVR